MKHDSGAGVPVEVDPPDLSMPTALEPSGPSLEDSAGRGGIDEARINLDRSTVERKDADTEETLQRSFRHDDGSIGTQTPSSVSDADPPDRVEERVPGSPRVFVALDDGPDVPPPQIVARIPRDIAAADGLGEFGDEGMNFPGIPAGVIVEEDDAHWEREDWNGVLEGQF